MRKEEEKKLEEQAAAEYTLGRDGKPYGSERRIGFQVTAGWLIHELGNTEMLSLQFVRGLPLILEKMDIIFLGLRNKSWTPAGGDDEPLLPDLTLWKNPCDGDKERLIFFI